MSDFTTKLADLPGFRKFQEKQSLNWCPRCDAKLKLKPAYLECANCGFICHLPDRRNDPSRKFDPCFIPDFTFGDWKYCFYCGEPPDCRDHVVPYSMYSAQPTAGSKPGTKVIACQDCNSRLCTKYFQCMADRVLCLQKSIQTKYSAALQFPEWGQHELDQLGRVLRETVQKNLNLKKWITKRLNWQTTTESLLLWDKARTEAKQLHPKNDWLQYFLKYENS